LEDNIQVVTYSSVDGSALWQQANEESYKNYPLHCLSTTLFECGGEKWVNANNQDLVLCTDCDPKPTCHAIDAGATVTGATWEGDGTLKVSYERYGGSQKDVAKLMWKDGGVNAASSEIGTTGSATFNDVPRNKHLFFGFNWAAGTNINVAAITQSSKAACTLRWKGAGNSGQTFFGNYRSTTGEQIQLRGLETRVVLGPPDVDGGPAIAKTAPKNKFLAELRRLGRLEEKGKPPPTGPHPLADAALNKYKVFCEVAPGVDAAAVLAFWLARDWVDGAHYESPSA